MSAQVPNLTPDSFPPPPIRWTPTRQFNHVTTRLYGSRPARPHGPRGAPANPDSSRPQFRPRTRPGPAGRGRAGSSILSTNGRVNFDDRSLILFLNFDSRFSILPPSLLRYTPRSAPVALSDRMPAGADLDARRVKGEHMSSMLEMNTDKYRRAAKLYGWKECSYLVRSGGEWQRLDGGTRPTARLDETADGAAALRQLHRLAPGTQTASSSPWSSITPEKAACSTMPALRCECSKTWRWGDADQSLRL